MKVGREVGSVRGKKKKDASKRSKKPEGSARGKKKGGKKDKKEGSMRGAASKRIAAPDADCQEAESEMPFVKDPDRPQIPNLVKPTEKDKEAYQNFAKTVCALGVQGLLTEWAVNVKPYITANYGRVAFDANPSKNRYKDIICNDLSRVILSDGKGNDYIHANYVRGEPLYNEFICTQGPMPDTVIDFWRMIVLTKAQNIVMLCEVKELNKVKCEQYWPATKGEKLTFGDFTIESRSVKSTSPVSSNAWIVKSHLIVSWTNNGAGKHHVMHHHWKNWPDRSAPRSGRGVLRILRDVRLSPRPTVVHCSAGIGRTGTLVAIEMCLQRLLSTGTLCLIDICKRLRDQRMSTIQVDVQYAYLAYVVLEYGKAFNFIQDNDDLKKFRADLDALLPPDAGFDITPEAGGKIVFKEAPSAAAVSSSATSQQSKQLSGSKEVV